MGRLIWIVVVGCLGFVHCVVGQGDSCQTNKDCLWEKPVCSKGMCMECRNDSDCGVGRSCKTVNSSSRCVDPSKVEDESLTEPSPSKDSGEGSEPAWVDSFAGGSEPKVSLDAGQEMNIPKEPNSPDLNRDSGGSDSAPGPEPSQGPEPSEGPEPSDCKDGQGRACYSGPSGTKGIGECKGGAQLCKQGTWGACLGEVVPTQEVCDNKDNNCDGAVDEGNPGGGATCKTGQFGVCSAGKTQCAKGKLACQSVSKPSREVCDGKDNDCDGQVDEGNPGGGGSCSTSKKGECKAGQSQCSGGMLQCVALKQASIEVCDGKDNDCDGSTDEGIASTVCYVIQSSYCYDGTSSCSGGKTVCKAKSVVTCANTTECSKCPGGSSNYVCNFRIRRCRVR
ncbi:MAG: hypothetical protein EP343_24900 [Deltaproteobacteria bacterium]|nr:MAG: hypothetical protein EP343_24900 [Deltaproteobacteria bacterium]